MLKIVYLTGGAGAGKSRLLETLELALIAERRQVLLVGGRSTATGIAQALKRYQFNQHPIPRAGWRRLLPGFLFTEQFAEGPPTLLIDECSDSLLLDLRDALAGIDAHVVAVPA